MIEEKKSKVQGDEKMFNDERILNELRHERKMTNAELLSKFGICTRNFLS